MCGCVKNIAQKIIDFHGKLFLKNLKKGCKIYIRKTNIKLPWLITTSCLIPESLIFGRKSESFGQWFKLLAEDLDIWARA